MNPTYKILVLRNDRLFTQIGYDQTKQYFSDRGINISFAFKDVTELVSIHEYKKVQGFNWKTGQPALISYMGLDDIVKDNCRKYVKEGEYDCVIFSWDVDALNHPLLGTEIVTSWNNFKPLYANCGFIQLAINQYDVQKASIFNKVSHEIMHELANGLNRKGYLVVDEMDNTIVGGQVIPYYKNDNPFAIDGNYAHTFKNISPYISKLYTVIDFFKTQEFVPKKIYEQFGESSNWFVDPRLRKLANFVRTFFGKSVTINNWAWGGQFDQSGFREPASTTGAPLSQHRFGRAMDIKIAGMTPREVYNAILANEKVFMDAGLTCMENIDATPTWTHLDMRQTGSNRILIVNP